MANYKHSGVVVALMLLNHQQTNALLAAPSSVVSSPSCATFCVPPYQVHRCSARRLKHSSALSQRRHLPLIVQSAASDAAGATVAVERNKEDEWLSDETPIAVAMGVGVVTSLIGYLYSKSLKTGFNLLWNRIPNALLGNPGTALGKLLHQYPAAYILLTMSLGGTLVAALSVLCFPKRPTAHDYVHVLSSSSPDKMDDFPKARRHLLPVLLMSLLTSISGFSLGPEAPMVRSYVSFDMQMQCKVRAEHSHFFL